MPIYERWCFVCGGSKEVLLKMSNRDAEVICEKCHVVMGVKVTMPAKTAGLWDGGWKAGLAAGYFSPSLGKQVSSKNEERRIMESKGFVAESDMGSGFIDNMIAKKAEETAATDKMCKTYIDNLTKYSGDKIKAVTETFPAHEMLKQA